jgi:ATP-binding cassette, subfamily B, bacterial
MVALLGLALIGGISLLVVPAGLWVALLGLTKHKSNLLVLGVAALSIGQAANWVAGLVETNVAGLVEERSKAQIVTEIAHAILAVRDVSELSDPAYVESLALLQQQRDRLGEGPRLVAASARFSCRAVGTVVLLAVISPFNVLLAIACLAPFGAAILNGRAAANSDRNVAVRTQRCKEAFAQFLEPTVMAEARLYGIGGELRALHSEVASSVVDARQMFVWVAALVETSGWCLFAVAALVVLSHLAVEVTSGAINVGGLLFAFGLSLQMGNLLGEGVELTKQWQAVLSAVRTLLGIEQRGLSKALSASVGPVALREGIRLEDVSYDYPDGRRALSNVNLTIPAGTFVALVGENGAGKSTLVRVLSGVSRPTLGRVTADGIDLYRDDPTVWQRRVAASFQDAVRFELAARDVVGVGDLPRLHDTDAVRNALRRGMAAHLEVDLRDGLATELGQSFRDGADLSGGQWQSLALARGLMRDDPLVVLLDEPTASLDPQTEYEMFRSYKELARTVATRTGAISILVTHRFSTARDADLIVVIADGHVTEIGSHESLMRDGGHYAELFELQAQAYR